MADKTANPRPQFGNRMLTDPSKVFEHNAWDNVEWGEEQEEEAQAKIAENAAVMVDEQLKEKYENEANQFWDEFYTQHQNRFFKDRHWLFTEFPELDTPTESEAVASSEMLNNECYQKVTQVEEAYPGVQANKRILEVGCGVGNTVFPILEANK
ncbi:predicted protein [Nematostella vectensis]|uniref:Methyltransferase-like protein n=1 Tax=Nematostella vectensis TaxID=45351 RepID=A7RI23_NEMVE|nr:predicted protein [Nematostella vectensis]|eukprot:XP_001641138.1 predicted protein [Nematostella vectensis]